jgi:uncharacterized membrane protein (DUF373 family)
MLTVEVKMTNEEIAKDLTIALINKMTNPTTDNASDIYHEILQKIAITRQVATLQTIEDHLKKQDQDLVQTVWIALIAFAGSIAVAGGTLVFQSISSGWSMIIYGVILVIFFWIMSVILQKKQDRTHRP